MHDYWTAPLLRQLAPRTRILVMLRDPVERYRSGLAHELGKSDPPSPVVLANDAFARGLYHRQLERVLTYFDRDQVLVIQHEACLLRPAAELRRTHAFLGLDSEAGLPEQLTERVNPAPGVKADLTPQQEEVLRDGYREDTARLLAAFPHLEADLWPSTRQGT